MGVYTRKIKQKTYEVGFYYKGNEVDTITVTAEDEWYAEKEAEELFHSNLLIKPEEK